MVKIDIKLDDVDINQCYMPYYEANAFKNSDRCDYYSTLVNKLIIIIIVNVKES